MPSVSVFRALAALTAYALILASCAPKKTAATPTPDAPSRPTLLWKFKSDGMAFASPIVARDGTIYDGANDGVYAITPEGTRKWKAKLYNPRNLTIGPDGTIFAATAMGQVAGLSPSGDSAWDSKYGLIGFEAPPAASQDGTLYFANTVSDLYAFRPPGDAPAWSLSTVRPGAIAEDYILPGTAKVGQTSKAPPALWRDQTIALGRQHWLHLFDPGGIQAWYLELTPGKLGAIALADDGTIYVTDDRGTLFAVDRSGQKLWEFVAGSMIWDSPVIDAQGTIYFATGNQVFALAPDGTVKWKVIPPQVCRSSPTLAADGTLYIGGADGLMALDSSGQAKWSARFMTANGAPAIGPNGAIYFNCGYSWICAVRDTDQVLMQSPWPRWQHDSANTGNILTHF